MVQPIHIQDERLAQYMQLFRDVFSRPQWKYFVIVLLGLIHCDERRTLSALLRHLAIRVTIFGLCYFLRAAPWSVDKLTAVRQAHFYEHMAPIVADNHKRQYAQRKQRVGRPKATVVTGFFIIDDSTHAKRYARVQQGLGHHYSSTEKCVVKGHSLYQSVYVLEGQHMPLTPHMYRQKKTCQAEGVPFASKVDMAYHEITHFEPAPNTRTHVLADCWYSARRIWRAALDRDWDITTGLRSNRRLRLVKADGSRQWLKLSEYAAQLTSADLTPVGWPTQEGEKIVYAHLTLTWVRKLGPCQVLIVKLDPDDPPEKWRYWATSRLEDSLEQVVAYAAQRWAVEVLYADFKELMGSDHYQVRSAQGIIRFWALGLCLYQFFDEVRVAHQRASGERLTMGQVRQHIRAVHRDALLSWICDQVEAGASHTEIRQALQPAMQL